MHTVQVTIAYGNIKKDFHIWGISQISYFIRPPTNLILQLVVPVTLL